MNLFNLIKTVFLVNLYAICLSVIPEIYNLLLQIIECFNQLERKMTSVFKK